MLLLLFFLNFDLYLINLLSIELTLGEEEVDSGGIFRAEDIRGNERVPKQFKIF